MNSNTPGKCSDEIPVPTCSTKKISTEESISAALDRGIEICVNEFLRKRSSGSENSEEEFPMKKHSKISCGDESKLNLLSLENILEYRLYLLKHGVIFESEIGSNESITLVTERELDFIFKKHWTKQSEFCPKKVMESKDDEAKQQALFKKHWTKQSEFGPKKVMESEDEEAEQQALFLLIRARKSIVSLSKTETEFREGVSNNEDVMRKELGVANTLSNGKKMHRFLKYIEVPADKNEFQPKAHKILFVEEYKKSGKTARLLSEICNDIWLVFRCVYIILARDSNAFDKIDYHSNFYYEDIGTIGDYMKLYMDFYLLELVDFRVGVVQSTKTFLYNLFEKFDIQVTDFVHSTARKNLRITFVMIENFYTMLPSNVALFCFLDSLKKHDVLFDLQQMAYFVVIPEDIANSVVAQDASWDIQKSSTFIKEELEKFSLLLLTNTENVPTSPGYDPS
jgi:hypothetical protein